jgi:putative FmdB family regulatory protein
MNPAMPIYEFDCEACGARFEELVAGGTERHACPECGEPSDRRLSNVAPPRRLERGPGVRDAEKRRVEREAARGERLAETRKKRAAGDIPPPRPAPGKKNG